ncbi:jg25 [Pararge aegeria aegeria]|uniref:Jg25 protein n=2 Tax=Pararge aegeria TaxID=116150 RepID=A0A8S4R2L9_9NEOP|nr:jg25 [Pararge aegeria aegeria]
MYGIFLSVFILLVYSIIFQDLKNGDSTQACANGILCVVYIVVTFNYCIMFTYRNVLEELIDRMNHDYKLAKNFPEKEQDIVLSFAQKGQGIAKIWLIVGICACGLFIVKQFYLTIYYTITSEFRLIHLYDLTYPDAVEQVKYNTVVFCILYIYFLYYDVFATMMFIGFSPLGSIFMLHACGQLEIAKERILEIFKEYKSSEEINKQLKEVATFLNTTYR